MNSNKRELIKMMITATVNTVKKDMPTVPEDKIRKLSEDAVMARTDGLYSEYIMMNLSDFTEAIPHDVKNKLIADAIMYNK